MSPSAVRRGRLIKKSKAKQYNFVKSCPLTYCSNDKSVVFCRSKNHINKWDKKLFHLLKSPMRLQPRMMALCSLFLWTVARCWARTNLWKSNFVKTRGNPLSCFSRSSSARATASVDRLHNANSVSVSCPGIVRPIATQTPRMPLWRALSLELSDQCGLKASYTPIMLGSCLPFCLTMASFWSNAGSWTSSAASGNAQSLATQVELHCFRNNSNNRFMLLSSEYAFFCCQINTSSPKPSKRPWERNARHSCKRFPTRSCVRELYPASSISCTWFMTLKMKSHCLVRICFHIEDKQYKLKPQDTLPLQSRSWLWAIFLLQDLCLDETSCE